MSARTHILRHNTDVIKFNWSVPGSYNNSSNTTEGESFHELDMSKVRLRRIITYENSSWNICKKIVDCW